MVIIGLLTDLPEILLALNPSGSIEGGGCSIRLDDPPVVSDDGLRVIWVDDRWGDIEREWFEIRGAGLVTVLDTVPSDWYTQPIIGE